MRERDTHYDCLIRDRDRAIRSLERLTNGSIVSSEMYGADLVRIDVLESEKADYRSRIEVCNSELRAHMSRGEILERHQLLDVEYEIEPNKGLYGVWMIAFHSAGNPLSLKIDPRPLACELRAYGHVAMADQIDDAIAKVAEYYRAA